MSINSCTSATFCCIQVLMKYCKTPWSFAWNCRITHLIKTVNTQNYRQTGKNAQPAKITQQWRARSRRAQVRFSTGNNPPVTFSRWPTQWAHLGPDQCPEDVRMIYAPAVRPCLRTGDIGWGVRSAVRHVLGHGRDKPGSPDRVRTAPCRLDVNPACSDYRTEPFPDLHSCQMMLLYELNKQ